MAADCTGHGVPGALMSMIGLKTLDRIIQEGLAVHPGDILNLLSTEVESTFNRDDDGSYAVKDGMDIAVCMIDKKRHTLEFAGSFLPLYLIREGNLLEYKGEKHVIGRKITGQDFTSHQIEIFEGDTFYMYTDGYVDQFGGTENKKFMNRRLRYLLVSIHKYNMADQKIILSDNITSWMGNNEQVDDIMVIGFRL
jgi:serine phosphatase RsbU (regulator of sigma subunit)